MNDRKFINQFQPQTLVSATVLCYIQALFMLLGGWLPLFLFAVGLGAGGYGIANEKKWGYGLAVTASIAWVALVLMFAGADVLKFPLILNFMFDIALVALLLHRESRDYQRIWFK